MLLQPRYTASARARWDARRGSKSATESPRPNGPATAVTPAGKSDLPLDMAATAPASNVTLPRGLIAVIHCLRAVCGSDCAVNHVAFAPFSSASKGRKGDPSDIAMAQPAAVGGFLRPSACLHATFGQARARVTCLRFDFWGNCADDIIADGVGGRRWGLAE